MNKILVYLFLFYGLALCQQKHKIVEIVMDDYSFEPQEITIPSGEKVELRFINKGDAVHEFLAGKKITEDNEGYREDLFDGIKISKYINDKPVKMDEHSDHSHGVTIEIKPGEEGSLIFTLPANKKGEWEMGCFIEFGTKTHHDLGMHGRIIVE
jgi:uncharacterized cupredoxin-like copper-binding protein